MADFSLMAQVTRDPVGSSETVMKFERLEDLRTGASG
jgi:hypothetical protein